MVVGQPAEAGRSLLLAPAAVLLGQLLQQRPVQAVAVLDHHQPLGVLGVVLTGRKGQRFKALAGYEPTRKDAVFADLVTGDLNGDGSPDIVLTDTNEHFVEIVAARQNGTQLDRALSFKVFERKSFREVGEHLGVTAEAARRLVSRAVAGLREDAVRILAA